LEKVLVTGGAGFIGRFVTSELLRRGHQVRVLDSLIEQVHGGATSAEALDPEAEFIRADVRDRATVNRALAGVDSVIHLAAEVGVGQSMYAVERYTSVNDVGTAVLFEALIDSPSPSRHGVFDEHLWRGPCTAMPMAAWVRGCAAPARPPAAAPAGTRSTRRAAR
jgi:nucleoside-diphosphate-sugar epimerase